MGAEKILLAVIGAAHGVRGEVRVKTYTADPTALEEYGALLTSDGRTLHLERLRPAREVVIAKFRGVDDRNAAEALNGTELFIPRDRLPPTEDVDQFYDADLLGMEAFSAAGEPLGTVVALHDFGAGDILEVAPARGPSRLVPFTKEAVPTIDLSARRLVVAPPPDAEDDEDDPKGSNGEQP